MKYISGQQIYKIKNMSFYFFAFNTIASFEMMKR